MGAAPTGATIAAARVENNVTHRWTFFLTSLCWLIALVGLPPPTAAQHLVDEERATRIASLFEEYARPRSPGCAVGIVRDGKLVYERAFGEANLEHGVPLTSESLVEIGSFSKTFTAICVAQLLDEGKLSLDDDIRKHVPDLQPFDPPIRVRHLIECRTGLWEHYHIMPLAGWDNLPISSPYQREDALAVICGQRTLPFAPGTEFRYGSFDYFLLGEIVRSVSGQPLSEFARARVFRPCGMDRTLFEEAPELIVPGRATCHLPAGNGVWRQWQTHTYVAGGSGVLTCVRDLANWDRALLEGRLPRGRHIDGLVEQGQLLENRKVLSVFPETEYRGLKCLSFTGGVFGAGAAMLRFPSERVAVIVLTNCDAPAWDLAHQVVDVALEDHLAPPDPSLVEERRSLDAELPIKLAPNELRTFTGAFRPFAGGAIWRVELRDTTLVLVDHLDQVHRLEPVGESRFRVVNSPQFLPSARFAFSRGESPKQRGVTQTWLTDRGRRELRYVPVELVAPTADKLAEYAGDYHNSELPVTYRIQVRNGGLRLRVGARRWEELEPTVADEFIPRRRTGHDQRFLRFARDADGNVSHLLVSFWRVRDLRLDKRHPDRIAGDEH